MLFLPAFAKNRASESERGECRKMHEKMLGNQSNLLPHPPRPRCHQRTLAASWRAFSTPKVLVASDCCWAIDCRSQCTAHICEGDIATMPCRKDPSPCPCLTCLLCFASSSLAFVLLFLGSLMIMPFWLLLCVFCCFWYFLPSGLCSCNIFVNKLMNANGELSKKSGV